MKRKRNYIISAKEEKLLGTIDRWVVRIKIHLTLQGCHDGLVQDFLSTPMNQDEARAIAFELKTA